MKLLRLINHYFNEYDHIQPNPFLFRRQIFSFDFVFLFMHYNYNVLYFKTWL